MVERGVGISCWGISGGRGRLTEELDWEDIGGVWGGVGLVGGL